ncbi:hypothetical protein ACIQXF_22650 [Lysinibacillus sp. NPDC097231]|uniref:hypothetical protein n=1 Tax=Lysinibacillus sp. NPDC097231 TaxID=3364142 RepID=UPI00380C393C
MIIKPVSPNTADKTFTVKMKDEAVDFNITGYTGNKFKVEDFGKYVALHHNLGLTI